MASELGAASVGVYTAASGSSGNSTKLRIFEEKFRGIIDANKVSRGLGVFLLIAGALACLAVGADTVIGGNLENEQFRLVRQIANDRAAISGGGYTAAQSAVLALDRRKQETPAGVIALEALSHILPDSTYVTELRLQGNRLQIVGVTQDAPELIRLIEQSSHFTRATFVAPTTRSPTDPGERFHIEARIEPINDPRP
jgi:general secretion pathway protein L